MQGKVGAVTFSFRLIVQLGGMRYEEFESWYAKTRQELDDVARNHQACVHFGHLLVGQKLRQDPVVVYELSKLAYAYRLLEQEYRPDIVRWTVGYVTADEMPPGLMSEMQLFKISWDLLTAWRKVNQMGLPIARSVRDGYVPEHQAGSDRLANPSRNVPAEEQSY